MIDLRDYGWDDFFEKEWNSFSGESIFPGRITADYGQKFRVISEFGELTVNRPVNRHGDEMQYAVGDWVVLESPDAARQVKIRSVMARKSKFSRFASGIEVKEQIVAANIDIVFLMQSLNRDFNVRRLERYLIAAWGSGAAPVVILSKTDLCDNPAEKTAAVYAAAPGVEVHAVSCVTGEGIEDIKKYFSRGKTVALLGSSGVGKSTLVNTLAGSRVLKTGEIREGDGRGKHTTTHREILLLPGGGLILDTPGMRELAIWEADTGMEVVFADIEELAKRCRFRNCRHQSEPGCAVKEALENGNLAKEKWESWLKLKKEQEYLEKRKETGFILQQKKKGKQMAKFKKGFKSRFNAKERE